MEYARRELRSLGRTMGERVDGDRHQVFAGFFKQTAAD